VLYVCLCAFAAAELLSLVRCLPYFQSAHAKAYVEEQVKQIIVEQLGVERTRVTPKARFEDLGADSMDMVELVMAFEETAEIEIPDRDAAGFHTVKDADDYIKSHIRVYNQAPEALAAALAAVFLGFVLGIALHTSQGQALRNTLLGAVIAVQCGSLLLNGDWLLFFSMGLGLFVAQLRLPRRATIPLVVAGGTALCYGVAALAENVATLKVQALVGVAKCFLVFLCCLLAYVFFRAVLRFPIIRRFSPGLTPSGSGKLRGLSVALALAWLYLVPQASKAALLWSSTGFAVKLLIAVASCVYCLWVLGRNSSKARGPLFAMLLGFSLPLIGLRVSNLLGMLVGMAIIGFIRSATDVLPWPRERWLAFAWLACWFVAAYVVFVPDYRAHDWLELMARWRILGASSSALAFGLGMRPALSLGPFPD
jgi:acyl carrier protein